MTARGVSPQWTQQQERAWRAFSSFCLTAQLDPTKASGEDVAAFLISYLYGDTPPPSTAISWHDLPPTRVTGATVANLASALRAAFSSRGLPPQPPHEFTTVRRAVRAARKLHNATCNPPPLSTPLVPADLIPFLPRGDSFAAIRDRCLFSVRATTGVRPSEPLGIFRSSIRSDHDMLRRPIVIFRLAKTKSSSATGALYDSNYVEFLDPDTTFPDTDFTVDDICPARLLLRLRDYLNTLSPVPRHDHLFTWATNHHRLISPDTASKIITNLMLEAGFVGRTAHFLRSATNQFLNNLGVPASDIEIRGGWKSSTNSVRVNHYTTFRLVSTNFAQAILDYRVRESIAHHLKNNLLFAPTSTTSVQQSGFPRRPPVRPIVAPESRSAFSSSTHNPPGKRRRLRPHITSDSEEESTEESVVNAEFH